MTAIGDLDRRLVLQAPVDSDDGSGGVTRSYQTVTTLWAQLTPARARADVSADSLAAIVTHSIVIRAPRAISTLHRFQDGERIFRIVAYRDSADRLQRWWRPVYALELTLFECPGFGVVLFHALWAGAPQTVNGFANLSGLIMAYMAARFGVLGVYVSGRSKEKQAAATGAAVPTAVGQLIKAVTKRG